MGNNRKSKVSIIIPVFNGAKTIKQTVDSVLLDIYPEKEIIVVDDGSTDDTLKTLTCYRDQIIVVSKKNGGVSSARNTGIDMATGKYIMFVDSDDCCACNYVSRATEAIETSNADITIFGFRRITDGEHYEDFVYNPTIFRGDDVTHSIEFIMQNGMSSPWNKIYKSEIIKTHNLRFDEQLPLGEDLNFNMKCLFKASSIQYISDILYFYHADNSIATKKYREDLYEKRRNALDKMNLLFKDYGMRNPFEELSEMKIVYTVILNLQNKSCKKKYGEKRKIIKDIILIYKTKTNHTLTGVNRVLSGILRHMPVDSVYIVCKLMKCILAVIPTRIRGVSI